MNMRIRTWPAVVGSRSRTQWPSLLISRLRADLPSSCVSLVLQWFESKDMTKDLAAPARGQQAEQPR
jgi:hypothetical protein